MLETALHCNSCKKLAGDGARGVDFSMGLSTRAHSAIHGFDVKTLTYMTIPSSLSETRSYSIAFTV